MCVAMIPQLPTCCCYMKYTPACEIGGQGSAKLALHNMKLTTCQRLSMPDSRCICLLHAICALHKNAFGLYTVKVLSYPTRVLPSVSVCLLVCSRWLAVLVSGVLHHPQTPGCAWHHCTGFNVTLPHCLVKCCACDFCVDLVSSVMLGVLKG